MNEQEQDMKNYGGAGGRGSGTVTENDVSGERKFPPLPLRSHALDDDLR